jgi:photosystem II stability/assembly factor-like uncharacterized protein
MKYHKSLSLFAFLVVGLMLTGQSCLTGGTAQASAATGMFRSDDKGETWKETNAFPTAKGIKSLNTLNIYRFFTDPSDPDAVYATTRGQGVYYTYDRGDNWREIPALANRFINSLVVDPKNKCTIYATDSAMIYKTVDCARTWTTVYSEVRSTIKIQSVAVDFGSSQVLYAALSGGPELGGDVLISSDAGKSWQAIKHINFDVTLLATDPLSPRRLYVVGIGQNAGLVRSDDAGVTWKDITTPLQKFPGNLEFRRLVLHPSQKDTLFWISKYGILRSNDAGVTWTEYKLIPSPGSVDIYSFGISPISDNEIYFTATIASENDNGKSYFYKSVDGGKNWSTKKLPTGTVPSTMYLHPKEPNVIMLGFTSLK